MVLRQLATTVDYEPFKLMRYGDVLIALEDTILD
jgi:hypothetical protein